MVEMDLPQPPQDQELRNIIDKLAQFVARNGPDFEKMTKNKQKNNPKFGFLYGGDYFNYYQYKVTTEQAILKQSGQGGQQGAFTTPPPSRNVVPPVLSHSQLSLAASLAGSPNLQQWLAQNMPPMPPAQPPPSTHPQVELISAQQSALQEQIKQSENNLNAQHTVLIQQQQTQIEETVIKAQNDMIEKLAEESNITLSELDDVLKPIIDSCTKDSISAGKGWILSHATNHESGKVISQYLLKKVIQHGAPFSQKLHIIYLVNDVLHHCARKNAEDLKKSLETVVVPMFCNTSIAVTEEQEAKLSKLLKLWESKSNYFSPEIIEKMKNPTVSYQDYQSGLMKQYAQLIAPLTIQTKSTFEGYQGQHQVFISHTLQQIQQLEIQKQTLERQLSMAPLNNQEQTCEPPNSDYRSSFTEQLYSQMEQQSGYDHRDYDHIYDQPGYGDRVSNSNGRGDEDSFDGHSFNQNSNQDDLNLKEENEDIPPLPAVNFSLPPPGFPPPDFQPPDFQNGLLPDLTKPPPGFPIFPEVNQEDLMPAMPYYELPAGLIVPLIMLEDSEYKPLDPDSIRLPPPAPPNERLLAAVEAFYAAPNHERPRDSEGWEKLGLYEYYKAKNHAKKLKEDAIKSGLRQKSKSPSPIPRDLQKQNSPRGRRYRSKSRSKTPSKSRSPSPEARRSAATPRRRERERNDRDKESSQSDTNNSRSRNRRRSRSHSRSRSRSPPSNFGRERNNSGGSRHRTERSPTPPSFLSSSSLAPSASQELDASNKGHQMLRRMGWGEGGLGAAGQGIAAPVDGGSVRDKRDQYKGVGVNLNDPYENFRKNKGAAFITRMKERALERT